MKCLVLAALGALVLVGCVGPQARAALEQMLAQGTITQDQFDALYGAMQEASAWSLTQQLLQMTVAVLTSVGLVQTIRGPRATPQERIMRKAARKSALRDPRP